MLTISDLKAAIADLPNDMPVALSYFECDDTRAVENATKAERGHISPSAGRSANIGRELLGRDVLVIS